jgi:orotate phosphoribosyltransferase
MVSIFNYRFQAAEAAFEKAGVPLYSLTDYPSLIELGSKNGSITENQEEVLLNWRKDPASWTGVS